jgi:hypothetical protein
MVSKKNPSPELPPANGPRVDVDMTPSGQPPPDELEDPALYARARDTLVEILKGDGTDPAHADHILREIDRAWRAEDQRLSYWRRLRGSKGWESFRESWSEHTRRGRLSFATFDRHKRKLGATAAAARAAKDWDEPINRGLGKMPVRAQPMPALVWETIIGNLLIDELERKLGRPLRFSRSATGGPDIRLLVELYAIAATGRRPTMGPPPRPRGKGVRQPGSTPWFVHMVRYRRSTAGSWPR